jgi:hypothetical protein
MGMTTLAAYAFGFELNKIRYPWKESLQSALTLADHVYFCECYGNDGTYEDVMCMADKEPKLTVVRHTWEGDYHIQAIIGNMLLDEIGTKQDFALKLDMDEVIHEKSVPSFKVQLGMLDRMGVNLIRPHYTHFSPDFKHTFPFIYDSKAVISRTSRGLRYDLGHGGDACALGGDKEVQSTLELYHYGKVATGREQEALYKEVEFTKKYVDMGFPDPKVQAQVQQGWLDYNRVFDVSKAKGEFKFFAGNHPKVVQPWISVMEQNSVVFWKDHKDERTASEMRPL